MAADDDKKSASALTRIDDDTVTLIAYSIVSIQRGRERIMDGGEGSVIVTEKMSSEAFTSWILAKYLQQEVDVPCHPVRRQKRAKLIQREELQYLRVYYVVSNRWPREPLEFEQKQVATLRDISDAIGRH
jgi:hypothetical protein